MRPTINADHCNFYKKNNYIVFEEVLTPAQIDTLNAQIDLLLAKRLKTTPEKLKSAKGSEIFERGFDLWREEEKIKKATQKLPLAALATEVFQIYSLRIAFDQFVCTPIIGTPPFTQPLTLQESSSLNPLAGAMVLQLSETSPMTKGLPLIAEKGSALFISPQYQIDWPALFATENLRFLIVAFAMEKTLYRADTKDPHASTFKRLGYVFGDRLNDVIHPFLIRK